MQVNPQNEKRTWNTAANCLACVEAPFTVQLSPFLNNPLYIFFLRFQAQRVKGQNVPVPGSNTIGHTGTVAVELLALAATVREQLHYSTELNPTQTPTSGRPTEIA